MTLERYLGEEGDTRLARRFSSTISPSIKRPTSLTPSLVFSKRNRVGTLWTFHTVLNTLFGSFHLYTQCSVAVLSLYERASGSAVILWSLAGINESRLRLVEARESRLKDWQSDYDVGTPRNVCLRVLGSQEYDEKGVCRGWRELQVIGGLWQGEVAEDRHYGRRMMVGRCEEVMSRIRPTKRMDAVDLMC